MYYWVIVMQIKLVVVVVMQKGKVFKSRLPPS